MALVGGWLLTDATGPVADESGNGRTGAITGTVTLGSAGTVPAESLWTSASFPGTVGNLITVTNNAAFSPATTGKFSIETSFVIPSTPTGTGVIVAKGKASNFEWSIFVTATTMGCTCSQLGGTTYSSNTYVLPALNTPHHYIMALDTTDTVSPFTSWLDGVLHNSSAAVGSMAAGSADVTFGQRGDATQPFNGRVGPTWLYNTTLSAESAADHYAAWQVGSVVGGPSVTVSTSAATLTWTSTPDSASQVEYGLTTGYGSSTIYDPLRGPNHSVVLTGLTAGTTYFYRIRSRSQIGTESLTTGSFLTTGVVTPPATGVYATAILATAGLIGYWRFAESTGTVLADSSSGNHPLTLHGSAALGGAAVVPTSADTSISFPSPANILNYADVPDLIDWSILNTGQLSVELSFEITATPSATNVMISKAASSQFEWAIWVTATNLIANVWDLGGTTYATAAFPLPSLNTPHHVVMSIDSTQSPRMYLTLDGATATKQASTDSPRTLGNGTGNLTFGRRGDATLPYAGLLAHVSLYNVALGDGTVALHYAAWQVPAPQVPIVIPPQITHLPQLVVEVAFSALPTTTPVWTDITRYVQTMAISRGRQRELDQVMAGTLSLNLINRDRRFEMGYAGSPYYPGVIPMRRIRVRATYNGSNYYLYGGYVESWGQTYAGYQDDQSPVEAADAFKVLNLAKLNTSFPAQTSDARVNAVLGAIGWTVGGAAWLLNISKLGIDTIVGPTGDRLVTPGSATLAAATLTNASALSHLQDVANTEQGLLFTNVQGQVVFYGRQHALGVPQLASLGTFGENEMPYVSIQLAGDDSEIWNEVRLTAVGGTEQTASDATSQSQYYLRTFPNTATLHNSDLQASSMAFAILHRYAQPARQVVQMTLDGEADPENIYPQMLGRELGDRVTVIRRPQFGGTPITQVSTIQGIDIAYDAVQPAWSTSWRLSPADTATYWILNSSTASQLGTTTRLFF